MQMKPLLNLLLKYRIGKKWKKRYCIIEKSPHNENALLFYSLKEEDYSSDNRPANCSDTILGFESGRHIDKEGYVMVLVGLSRVHCIAHSRDTVMFEWADTLAAYLTDSHYHVTLKKSSDSSRLQKGLQGSLHVQKGRLCLIGEPEFGNKFICSWPISSLTYWVQGDCYFWIEADKSAGKVSGKHQFELNTCQLNNLFLAIEQLECTRSCSPCGTMRTSVSIDESTSAMVGSFINAMPEGSQYDCDNSTLCTEIDTVSRSSEVQIPRSRKNSSPDRKRTSLVNTSNEKTENLIANATKEIMSQSGDPDCMFFPDEDLSHQEEVIKNNKNQILTSNSSFRHKEPHSYVNLQFDLSTPASSSAESASPSSFIPVYTSASNTIAPKSNTSDAKSQLKCTTQSSNQCSTQPSPTSSCSSSNSFKTKFLPFCRSRRRCSSNDAGNSAKTIPTPLSDDKTSNLTKIDLQRHPSHCEDALDYIKTPEDEVFTNPSSLEQELATIKEGQLASNSHECEEADDITNGPVSSDNNAPILRTSRSRNNFTGSHSVYYQGHSSSGNTYNSMCSSPPDNNSQSSSVGLNRRNSLATSAPSASNFCSRRSLKLSSKCSGSHPYNEYCNDNCVYTNNSLPRDLCNRKTIPSSYVNLRSDVPVEVSNPRYNYAWLDLRPCAENLRPSSEALRTLSNTTSPPLSELPEYHMDLEAAIGQQSSNLNYVNVIAGSHCTEAPLDSSSSVSRPNGSVTNSSTVNYAQIDFNLTAALLDIGDPCDPNNAADTVSLSSTSPSNSTDKFRKSFVTKLKSFGSRRKSDSMSSSN